MKQVDPHRNRGGAGGVMRFSLTVFLFLTGAAGAFAQSLGDLEKLENELKATRGRDAELDRRFKALTEELANLRQQIITGARLSQEGETRLTRLETALRETKAVVRKRENALRRRKQQLTVTLGVMERLSRNPPRALILSQEPPIKVIRRAMLLRATLPVIRDRAENLRKEIDELQETRVTLAHHLDALRDADREHGLQKSELETLIARKALLLRRTQAERQQVSERMRSLAREAHSLKALFSRLEEERRRPQPKKPRSAKRQPPPLENARLTIPKPTSLRPFPTRGTITFPARGRVTRRYGENTGYGNTAKGITIETRPVATIIAPHDGKVVFAGPFRGYGQILIIEHGGGYHTLLAGMARVDGSVGQWLLAGEPVGRMAKSKGSTPQLYVELRRRGQPVNPLRWLAESRRRVRG